MRDFASVVQVPVLPVLAAEPHFLLRRRVRLQLVGDDDARRGAQALQPLAEEAPGRLRVAAALDQNVEDDAILVDGPPR